MTEPLRKRDRMLYGLVIPIAILALGLVVIMAMPTRAGAAEFASLGVMLISITLSPIILAVTAAMAWTSKGSKQSCFIRGMVAPGLVLLLAFAYQMGLLDV